MKIIAGLGNPGLRYRNTRHNAGFLAVKALAKKYHISLKKKGFGGVYGIGRILGEEVMLFEPMTYMNLSGEAVKSASSSKMEDRKDLLVISDDVSLPLGRIRLRDNGSSGGHNGLESIIGNIGADFSRLRLGVGEAPLEADMAAYVLSPFSRKERPALNEAMEKAVDAIEIWLKEGINKAMNSCNNN